jgi:predicted HicB family RNase H-like nuclease
MKDRAVVRMDPELHRQLKMHAAAHGSNVKALVEEAVRKYFGFKEGGEGGKD